jgi:hypothetical protein
MNVKSQGRNLSRQARDIRRQFDTDRIPQILLASLYLSYNPLDDVWKFLSDARGIFPRLNCGLASVFLQHTLGAGKIVTGTYQGNLHSFVLLDNDLIVDITADQFGGPSVYVGPLQTPWSLEPATDTGFASQSQAVG